MPGHDSYLGSERMRQNTFENILRNQGFTDDNNSGSVQDEEADYLKTLQRIKAKGDAGYFDMDSSGKKKFDEKTNIQKFTEGFGFPKKAFNSAVFGADNIPAPSPSAPIVLDRMMGGDEGVSNAKKFLNNFNTTGQDAEQDRLQKMRMLNGNTFNTGERSQGDQEAEQRMNQNEKTSILQKVGNFLSSPFTKTFGTKDQPKFNGQDGVMYNGKMVHPDFYKLMMNRPDLKNKFDSTGSIYD